MIENTTQYEEPLDWGHKAAKIISYAFHPLLMPFLSSLLVFNLGGYIVFSVTPNVKYLVYSIIFINTFIVPSLSSYILLKKGIIKSLQMHTKQERRFPFLLTVLLYFITYYFLQAFQLPPILFLMLLGATLAILVAMMVNLFYKLSLHMLGIGGLLGAIIGMSIRLSLELNYLIIVFVLLAGIIGYSRLKLNAHSHGQVYLGFLTGLFCMLITLLGV